jgi:hypothetical protein
MRSPTTTAAFFERPGATANTPLVKVSEGGPLDAIEEIQFQADVEQNVNHWWARQQAFDLGLIGDAFFKTFCDDMNRFMKDSPAIRGYVRELIDAYPETRDLKIVAPVFEEDVPQ